MKYKLPTILLLLFAGHIAATGIIIPTNYSQYGKQTGPILTIVSQEVRVTIRDQFATTSVIQIFRNHTDRVLEGTYLFPIPDDAQVSDFATWDAGVRIPGVIMEKRKAIKIYEELKWRAIDPGLLLPTERNLFKANIVPIPAHGTKRLEIEYTELLQYDAEITRYIYPLASESKERIGRLDFQLTFDSDLPVEVIDKSPEAAKLEETESRITLTMKTNNLLPHEDISLTYRAKATKPLAVNCFGPSEDERGYFMLLFVPPDTFSAKPEPKDILFLLDISASMAGAKMSAALEALEIGLSSLNERDRFAVIAFNDELLRYPNVGFASIGRPEIRAALEWAKGLKPMWGTNIAAAIEQISGSFGKSNRGKYVVIISDGAPSVGELGYKQILSIIGTFSKDDIRIFSLGIGNDATELLEDIALAGSGETRYLREYSETRIIAEPFFAKLSALKLSDIKLEWRKVAVEDLYPENVDALYLGGQVVMAGRFDKPTEGELTIRGNVDTNGISYSTPLVFENCDSINTHIPRLWAKFRVDHLLALIRREGEKDEWVEEIIELSKKYNFVTPYTAFLAAPRAVLRPRVIQPGDPYLHIEAPPGAVKVTVIFPFGETKDAVYNSETGLWDVRFLAPANMADGEYSCTVIIVDETGVQYTFEKTFIIDTKPPELSGELKPQITKAGEEILIRVRAPQDTRKITAKTPDGQELELKYNHTTFYSEAKWEAPKHLSPGTYEIRITATDFAGNTGHLTLEMIIE